MDFSKLSIKQIIPQRPPFLMVDRVMRCDETDAYLEFLITPENVLSEKGTFSAYGIIENMAQSCAALMGCWCILHDIPITIGYIGEIRNTSINNFPQCGQTINTHVHVIEEVFNIIMADVEVMAGDMKIASACIKVARTDIVANLKD